MKQDIRFKGLTLNRDEQAAEHGELALCGNIEVHDGALRPSVLKGTALAGGTELPGRLQYVHVTPSGVTNFIVVVSGQTGNFLKWYRDKEDNLNPGWYSGTIIDNTTLGEQTANITYNSISSVGNTLCIMTSRGLWYALFKDGTYTTLGQQPPFADLQFNLKEVTSINVDPDAPGTPSGSTRGENYQDIEMSLGDMGVGLLFEEDQYNLLDWQVSGDQSHFPISQMVRTSVTDQVMAEVNKRIHDAEEKGWFYAPFMIRYCYVLYDGSMVMHSAPVLMAPSLERSVLVSIRYLAWQEYGTNNYYVKNYSGSFKIRVFMMSATLQARWVNSAINTELQKWKDIVKSVDVFITPQFSRIDTAKQISSVDRFLSTDVYHSLMDGLDADFKGKFQSTSAQEEDPNNHNPIYNDYLFTLPEYDREEFLNRVRTASEFFRVASYKIEDLSSALVVQNPTDELHSFVDVDLSKSPLYNISTHQQMTDDYKTHNLIGPGENGGFLYTYNHRLNAYDIKEQLFSGFSPEVLFAYVKSNNTDLRCLDLKSVSTYIKTGSSMNKVTYTNTSGVTRVLDWMVKYFFYPDSRAVYATFKFAYQSSYTYYLIGLSSHPSMNGAIYDKKTTNSTLRDTLVGLPDNPYSSLRGKIYTSRVDNPFYFPNLPGESGINTVGTGDIIGIAAVTRALSQGQVGDHDLVVFATDGIWVMKVSSTGTYSAMHNISREVCDNKDSVCQLDQSIVFATKRSLSRFRESDVESISEALDGPVIDWSTKLPGFYGLFYQSPGTENPDPVKKLIQQLLDFGTPALDMFHRGKVLYDYASSRILVFDEASQYNSIALAFSLRDMAWSTLYTDYVYAAVSGYPSPYVHKNVKVYNATTQQYNDVAQLLRLDVPYDYDNGSETPGVIITRTLSFSDTMDLIRGFRQYCECDTMPTLYFFGSDDQLSWQDIGHSARAFHNYMPGHPFRFFRVAIVFSMTMSEKYQSLALEVINKYSKL